MPVLLWRQDDNGNRFLVGSYADRAAAEARLAELTRSPHKQTCWLSEEPPAAGRSPEDSGT
jgi:hypothetical protein